MANYCGRASVHVATISGHCIIMHHFVCMLVVSLNTVYAKTVIYTCTYASVCVNIYVGKRFTKRLMFVVMVTLFRWHLLPRY